MNVYHVTALPQVTVTVQERRQYTLDAASAEVAGRTRYIQVSVVNCLLISPNCP